MNGIFKNTMTPKQSLNKLKPKILIFNTNNVVHNILCLCGRNYEGRTKLKTLISE